MNLPKHITDKLHEAGHPNPCSWARRLEFGLADKKETYQIAAIANHLKRVLALAEEPSMEVRTLLNPTLQSDDFMRNLNEYVIPFMVKNKV